MSAPAAGARASHGFADPYQRETLILRPYATSSRQCRGRAHPEPESVERTSFQRDRDRIIHCAAFRRLEYKTQVFVNHEGDHYRTRLTHTLEVTQIARAVARLLGLNEDLVEAIALSHDLGHPPFGHAGEATLDELMAGAGGFDHNRHCLRVVTQLEQRYPDFDGLNLTWEVREAIVKHGGHGDHPNLGEYAPSESPSLEAQLVDVCDSLAYASHDIDDGIRSGAVRMDDFAALAIWRDAAEAVRARWPAIGHARHLVARTISHLIDEQIRDLVEESARRIQEAGLDSLAAVRRAPPDRIAFSAAQERRKQELHAFLKERLYHHPRTLRAAAEGQRLIREIFERYLSNPVQLPPEYLARTREENPHRVICDYVAGMTDRFCTQEHRRLTGSGAWEIGS